MHRLNSAATLIQRTTTEAPRGDMYYIGLDVHKKTISYCVKDPGMASFDLSKTSSSSGIQGYTP